MQFNLRGILLKWLPICPHIKHLRNASLGLLRLFWCAFKKPVCAEGAHSHLAETQWLHLSLKVNTGCGGPQIWPFQMPRPPRLSILCDNEQIPIQKHLLRDNVALCCRQHTWVNEWTAWPCSGALSEPPLKVTYSTEWTPSPSLQKPFDTLTPVQIKLAVKVCLW